MRNNFKGSEIYVGIKGEWIVEVHKPQYKQKTDTFVIGVKLNKDYLNYKKNRKFTLTKKDKEYANKIYDYLESKKWLYEKKQSLRVDKDVTKIIEKRSALKEEHLATEFLIKEELDYLVKLELEISKAGEELEDLVIKKAKDIKKAAKLEEFEKYLKMHDNVHERINKYSKHQKVKKWSNPRTAEYAKGLLK